MLNLKLGGEDVAQLNEAYPPDQKEYRGRKAEKQMTLKTTRKYSIEMITRKPMQNIEV